MYDFGTIAVGANIDNAINYIAWMESVAQKITLASMIGHVNTINGGVGEAVTSHLKYDTGINYNVYSDYDQILFKEEVARGTRLLNIRGYSPSGESGDTSVRDLRPDSSISPAVPPGASRRTCRTPAVGNAL